MVGPEDGLELEPQNVDELPEAIDGECLYRLHNSTPFGKGKVMYMIPADGRRWQQAQTANVKGFENSHGVLQFCLGTYICIGEECIFRSWSTFGQCNNQYFNISDDGKTRCRFCKEKAMYVDCNAIKCTHFYTDYCIVIHTGTHTCAVACKLL